jgi:hypothetical protein
VPIAGRKSLEALLFEFQEKVSLKARVKSLEEFACASKEKARPSDEKKTDAGSETRERLLDVLDSLETVSYDALVEPAVSEACLAVAKERGWDGKVLTLPFECPVGEDLELAAISLQDFFRGFCGAIPRMLAIGHRDSHSVLIAYISRRDGALFQPRLSCAT